MMRMLVMAVGWWLAAAVQAAAPMYVLVYDPALSAAAEALAAYRGGTGYTVKVIAAEPIGDADDEDRAAWRRHQLQQTIREQYSALSEDDRRGFMVCLLGDADAIAPWPTKQRDTTMLGHRRADSYISDEPYQYMDDADRLPDVSLGRIPARSNAEALAYLAKIAAYEQTGNDPAKHRVTYVAGEGHYGAMDRVLEQLFKEMIRQLVPPKYAVRVAYAKAGSAWCPPPGRLSETVLDELARGGLLFNYVGHGDITCFDRMRWAWNTAPVLCVDDLGDLPREPETLRPIALLTCCNAGWFDHPEPSLGEAMLFHPGGPVAVIAGSRVTHPYANTIVQKDVTTLLLKTDVATVGELDLRAAESLVEIDITDQRIDMLAGWVARADNWPSSLTTLRRMHTALYNLLGDPALRIARPTGRITDLSIDDRTLRGTIEDMHQGWVTIHIDVTRGETAMPQGLQRVSGPNDPALDEANAINYPLMNTPTLLTIEASVEDGQFTAPLPEIDPAGPRPALIRIYASGETDAGPLDAASAMSFPARLIPPPIANEADR